MRTSNYRCCYGIYSEFVTVSDMIHIRFAEEEKIEVALYDYKRRNNKIDGNV